MKKLIIILILAILINGCNKEQTRIDRESKIPENAIKITPETDKHPPILHSEDYYEPEPLQYPINTAGAEDSPFIPDNSDELYFFFTPDVKVPVEKQILDGVTGIYVSRSFQKPERIFLQKPGKLSLDGCEFIQRNKMWFCTAREGYSGLHWFTAELKEETWANWKIADFNPEYEIGELHIHENKLYFHSSRPGGKGNYDIWVSDMVNGKLQNPKNINIVNSKENDGWPYITPNGNELWFTKTYMGTPAIYRSTKVNNEWQEPELIISQFAGEPTLDNEGNIYFVHHFYEDGNMIEADIYIAKKK